MSQLSDLFHSRYSQWLDDALKEYNSKVSFPRKYHQQTCPEDYDPGDLVEIAENGDVYPHGIGGTNHRPRMVTPWAQSQHFI